MRPGNDSFTQYQLIFESQVMFIVWKYEYIIYIVYYWESHYEVR